MMRAIGPGGPSAKEMAKYHEARSPAARAAMADKADQDMMERMGREYDKRMPSPEPGEAKPKRYAKGGSVKGSGCEQRGLRKCKVV